MGVRSTFVALNYIVWGLYGWTYIKVKRFSTKVFTNGTLLKRTTLPCIVIVFIFFIVNLSETPFVAAVPLTLGFALWVGLLIMKLPFRTINTCILNSIKLSHSFTHYENSRLLSYVCCIFTTKVTVLKRTTCGQKGKGKAKKMIVNSKKKGPKSLIFTNLCNSTLCVH